MKRLVLFLFAILSSVFLPLLIPATASAAFNQNNIMSDYVYNNSGTMSAGQIDAFLNSFPNSCISTGKGFVSPSLNGYNPSQGFLYGGNVSAGTVIATAAQIYDLNPQVILATLQKEQSLVSGSAGCYYGTPPTQTCTGTDRPYGTHDSCVTACQYGGGCVYIAMGYDCPYYCVPGSTGFSKQIIKAAWKMKFVQQRSLGNYNWNVQKPGWDNSDDPQSSYDGYMTQGVLKRSASSAPVAYDGFRPVNNNSLSVYLGSGATASLYSFTPFTSGNTNFVNIFEGWFGSTQAAGAIVLERGAGSPIALAFNADGRLELMGVADTDSIYNKRQVSASSNTWTAWTQFPGGVRNIAAETNVSANAQMVGIASNGSIYYTAQSSNNSVVWDSWTPIDGALIAVSTARNYNGTFEVIGVAPNGAIYHKRQNSPHTDDWSAWSQIPGALKNISADTNADGRIQLVGVTSNGSVYTTYQTSVNSTEWAPWVQLDGGLANAALARNDNGTLEIFGIAGNGGIYRKRQTAANSTTWDSWSQMDGGLRHIAAEINHDGRLQLVGIAANGGIYYTSQTATNSTTWNAWAPMDGGLRKY